MLTLDIVHDFTRIAISNLDSIDAGEIRSRFAELEQQATEALEREGVPEERRALLHSLEMRYEGQEHTLSIPVGAELLRTLSLDRLRRTFDERHEVAYGYAMADPVELTAYRIRAVGTLDKPKGVELEPGGVDSDQARAGMRRANHRESGGELDWAIYKRERLAPRNRLVGPAIVEEASATTLVSPGQELVVDTLGNLVITQR